MRKLLSVLAISALWLAIFCPNFYAEKWTPVEDWRLLAAIQTFGINNWSAVAEKIPNRTQFACVNRYNRLKRKWTLEEDEQLLAAVQTFGTNNWSVVAERISNRTPRQCRERYSALYINKKEWTPEEDALLLEKIEKFDKDWFKVCQLFMGKTAENIRNRYVFLKKSLDQVSNNQAQGWLSNLLNSH